MLKSVLFRGLILASVPLKYSFADAKPKNPNEINKNDIIIISGTASKLLAKKVTEKLGTKLSNVETVRFSDGEIISYINESIRGKHVFILQTCSPPVNDNIMELLLTIAAARRSGASSVTAVIPCFGYYHHRRGLPISTLLNSRFLWNASADLAKMLKVVGVDKVISLDLQRPGQGHEACFFDSAVPVETISSTDAFVTYFKENIDLVNPVVVVAPNTEFVKKARKFQKKLKANTDLKSIEYATFLRNDSNPDSFVNNKNIQLPELLGDVNGADVILIDDYIDSGKTLAILCNRLKKEGAKRVFVCASHGIFIENCNELIDLSPIEKVIVTDSIEFPQNLKISSKIVQVSIANYLAKIIESDYHNCSEFAPTDEEDDVYEQSD